MENEEKREVQVPEWYHSKTDQDLLEMLERIDVTETDEKQAERQTMRTWILEELRRRNPKAIELWERHVFPECGNLQDYVQIRKNCLECEYFYPGGKEYRKKCGGMGPMLGEN